MKQESITFIGAGNMGTSLIGGLIADGYDPQKIWATDPDAKKLKGLQDQFGISTTTDNKEGTAHAKILIFAVKPNTVKQAAEEVKTQVQNNKPLIISIAAGIRTKHLSTWLGNDIPIVRCMPNTPALVRTGALGLYANPKVTTQQKDLAESIMRAVGLTIWLEDENHMDIVTALSGSGPAYFFFLMEALEQGAIHLGLSKEAAHLLTLQTALGAARMAMESSEDIRTLRQQVTSPGGTTERAIRVLEQGELTDLVTKALTSAYQRSIEMAEIYK